MINSNSHKQYFQQFSSRYIAPQHKKPRKIKLREMMDKRLKQSNNEQFLTLNDKN